MSLVIRRCVIDNDPKGETGIGTIFRLDVHVNGVLQLQHDYGLLEWLDGRFNLDSVVKPYVEAYKLELQERELKELEEKKAQKEARLAAVKVDGKLEQLIDSVLVDDVKAVEQYKSGKEKALNALVGKVIVQLKKQGQEADAFAITTAMKRKLA